MQLIFRLLNAKSGVKTAAVLLVAVLFVLAFASMTAGAPEITYGDINNDGEIDVRDVVLVMQYIIGLRDLTEDQLKAADVNGDGEVNVQDATMLMQYVLGLIESFTLPIISVEEIEKSVALNTSYDDINFPEKVTATLHDGMEIEVEVDWADDSTPVYNPSASGAYVFEGELIDLPDNVTNPDELTATATILVQGASYSWFVLTMEGRINGSPADSVYGDLEGEGTYPEETEVHISATPNEGYVFSYWSMDEYAGYFVYNDYKEEASAEFVYRNEPSLIYIMPTQDVTIYGNFESELDLVLTE